MRTPNKDFVEQMTKVFEEADKAFKSMEEKMNEVLSNEAKWQPHRSFMPRKVGKRWYMPGRLLFRKFVMSPGGGFYQYGTEFDVLKDS
jgi:hypothetical protein